MFRYTHCIEDVLLAKFQAIFREKERLEALLFYFLDTIPNRRVFPVQEAIFKKSLFRGLYGVYCGCHRRWWSVLCQNAEALKGYEDSTAFLSRGISSQPDMSGINYTKLRQAVNSCGPRCGHKSSDSRTASRARCSPPTGVFGLLVTPLSEPHTIYLMLIRLLQS